jgi:hypothetical protein
MERNIKTQDAIPVREVLLEKFRADLQQEIYKLLTDDKKIPHNEEGWRALVEPIRNTVNKMYADHPGMFPFQLISVEATPEDKKERRAPAIFVLMQDTQEGNEDGRNNSDDAAPGSA